MRRYTVVDANPLLLLALNANDLNLAMTAGRGLHSFPFQLSLSSSVHRITQLNS